MSNVVLFASPVVCDNSKRYFIPADDVLPNKGFALVFRDRAQRFYFGPLGKIIDSYNGILGTSFSRRHWSNQINSPMRKWMRTPNRGQWVMWLMRYGGKLLAFGTRLCDPLSIIMKSRTIVSLPYCFMSQRSSF